MTNLPPPPPPGPTGPVGPPAGYPPAPPPGYTAAPPPGIPYGYGAAPGTPAAPAVHVPSLVLQVLGAAGMVIGSFMVWASVFDFDIKGTDEGKDGTITLVLGIALAIVALVGIRKAPKAMAICGIVAATLGLLVGLVDIGDISSTADDLGLDDDVTVGPGLWLVTAASVAGLAGSIIALATLRRRRGGPTR